MVHMPVTDNGVVINISSTFSQMYMGDTQFAMYSASKAAVDSLTITYAKKWMGRKRVVGIAPGWVKSSWNTDMSDEDVKAMLAKPQVAKLVEPHEIADLMEAIIKNESINATTIVIDGGLGAPIV
jgi:3-oxoacyl-[acyl-carrier protein] reductase